jgi:predicted NUDIX family NTP pyrophosphohydrolase
VRVWAVEAPRFEVDRVVSNEFEIEWPPGSGERRSFPEVDRAAWVSAPVARQKLVKGQVAYVERLVDYLRGAGRVVADHLGTGPP